MRLPPHVSVHIYDHLQRAREQYFVRCGERSHPDRSSIHTHKPTVMTYGCIMHKHTTNVHQRNPNY